MMVADVDDEEEIHHVRALEGVHRLVGQTPGGAHLPDHSVP